jgi:hypothetical protein
LMEAMRDGDSFRSQIALRASRALHRHGGAKEEAFGAVAGLMRADGLEQVIE